MAQEKVISVLEIGSTSVVLLIARHTADGTITPLNEFVATTRLGADIISDKNISEEAINKTVAAIKEMQDIAIREKSQNIIVTASSLIRSAENRSKFLLKCHQCLNIYPLVLSGKEEARFSFFGATLDMAPDKPAFVIDIGGGSSEITYGTRNNIQGIHFLNMGCFGVKDLLDADKGRGGLSLLSSSSGVSAADYITGELLRTGAEPFSWISANNPATILCGGTATTYAALLKKQPIYGKEFINNTPGTRRDVHAMFGSISKMKDIERRNMPGMEVDRADLMPAGLYIIDAILKFFHIENFTVTTNSTRNGIIKYFIEKHPNISNY